MATRTGERAGGRPPATAAGRGAKTGGPGLLLEDAAARVADLGPWARGGAPAPPFQSIAVVGRPGSGAIDCLARLAGRLRCDGRLDGWRVAVAPAAYDDVADDEDGLLRSLASWLLDADGDIDGSEGVRRGPTGQGVSRRALETLVDGMLADRPTVLVVPRLDLLVDGAGPEAAWDLRRRLQADPILAIGAVPDGWAPGQQDAFYEFFRRVRLHGADRDAIEGLARRRRLTAAAARRLVGLGAVLDGRAGYVETAADLMAARPDATDGDVLRLLAADHAPALATALDALPGQARRILSAAAIPADDMSTGAIARRAGLHSSIAATQLDRLVSAGLLGAEAGSGRRKTWRFADPAQAALYRALVWPPGRLDAWLAAA